MSKLKEHSKATVKKVQEANKAVLEKNKVISELFMKTTNLEQ